MFSILHRCGWKPLKIAYDRKTKSWSCSHGNDKTYVLYGDKDDEYREYLRKIFNSELQDIPSGLKDALHHDSNLHGHIIKAFFITNGREGITLKMYVKYTLLNIIGHKYVLIKLLVV